MEDVVLYGRLMKGESSALFLFSSKKVLYKNPILLLYDFSIKISDQWVNLFSNNLRVKFRTRRRGIENYILF